MDNERLLDAEIIETDTIEENIRPQSLKEYVGQKEITEYLLKLLKCVKNH